MNVISISKFLTAVSFLLVSAFGNYGFAANGAQVIAPKAGTAAPAATPSTVESKEACQSNAILKCSQECRDTFKGKPTEIKSCTDACSTSSDYLLCTDKDSKTDGDSECKSAYENYTKDLADAESVCDNLSSTDSRTSTRASRAAAKDKKQECLARIDECAQRARETATNAPEGENRDIQTYTTIIDILQTRELPDPLATLDPSAGNSCLIEIDSKDAREQEKDLARERKEIMDEKQKIEDKAIEDKEANDKEINRITEKIQELQKDHKELLAKKDTEMREQLTQNQKDLVEASSRMRALNKQITQKNDATRSKTFQFSEALQDISKDKVDLKCREILQVAKDCMIKSAKGVKDESCKQFPVIRSKGPKATAELKAQLTTVNEACYEQASKQKRQAQFAQQEELKKASDEVAELQAQLRDEGQRQQIQSQNSAKIQQEAQRAKLEAEENLAAEQARLQGELAQFAQKIQTQQALSQQRLAEVMQRLADFDQKQRTGMNPKTAAARKAVRKTEAAINEVKLQCRCSTDASGLLSGKSDGPSRVAAATCATLKSSLPSGTGGTKLKSSTDRTSR